MKQIHKEVGVFPQYVKRCTAIVDELLEAMALLVATIDDVSHVRRQHKRRSVAFKVSEHLRVAKKFAEVNMKQVPALCDHDVVIVTIANAEKVGGDTVAGTRRCEVADGLQQFKTAFVPTTRFRRHFNCM